MTTITSSTITGITTVTTGTDVASKQYVDDIIKVPPQAGNSGKFLITTDGVSLSWEYASNYQEFTVPGSYNFNIPRNANQLFVEVISIGNAGQAGRPTGPGQAGGGGSYLSVYIPKSVIESANYVANVTIGQGGIGTAYNPNYLAGNDLGWGPGSPQPNTYFKISDLYYRPDIYIWNLGGPIVDIRADLYYNINGTSNGGSQQFQFQTTAGGAGSTSFGSSGGSINVYGINVSASGGTPSSIHGQSAVAIPGYPCGYGGGGGGANATAGGNGGNGVRGGGGGGGGSNGSFYGNGGNGGDGYVKITWF